MNHRLYSEPGRDINFTGIVIVISIFRVFELFLVSTSSDSRLSNDSFQCCI